MGAPLFYLVERTFKKEKASPIPPCFGPGIDIIAIPKTGLSGSGF